MAEFFQNIEGALNQPNLLFESWQVIVRIALTSFFSYFLLVVVLRILGMRTIADFSVYDFIATLTVGSVISSTLILSEVTLLNGLTAVLIFLGLQYIVSKLMVYFPQLNLLINPSPKIIFFKGEFREQTLKKARVNKEEVYSAIRREGGGTSDQVYAVILETNGSFSVITDVTEGYEDEITKYLDD